MSNILFFGDIIGRPGREAVAKILPELKSSLKPDLIIANVENIAHGKGVTVPILEELKRIGVDVFTSGNHVFDKLEQARICFEKFPQFIRPDNYIGDFPGKGVARIEKNGQGYTIINLNGRVFFEKNFPQGINNPFFEFDKLAELAQPDDILLVDFHADATSEKVAFGWYVDGRCSAVFGTHSHVPTQDWRVLPRGTAVVTDVGMNGPQNSVIGVKVENSFDLFLERGRFIMDPEPEGPRIINAVFVTCQARKSTSIDKIQKIL